MTVLPAPHPTYRHEGCSPSTALSPSLHTSHTVNLSSRLASGHNSGNSVKSQCLSLKNLVMKERVEDEEREERCFLPVLMLLIEGVPILSCLTLVFG